MQAVEGRQQWMLAFGICEIRSRIRSLLNKVYFSDREIYFHAEIDTWQRGDKVHKVHVIDPEVPEECVVLTRISVCIHLEDIFILMKNLSKLSPQRSIKENVISLNQFFFLIHHHAFEIRQNHCFKLI